VIVFLSWSGGRARRVAEGLRRWLPDVVAGARPWMSDHDLLPGQRIGAEVSSAMDRADCGVLVLTRENTDASASWWIPFEAGYLRASARSGSPLRVIPLLVDGLTAGQMPDAVRQFAALDLDRQGMAQLVLRIDAVLASPQGAPAVREAFERHWPPLEQSLELGSERGLTPGPAPTATSRPPAEGTPVPFERQEAAALSEVLGDLLASHGHDRPQVDISVRERSIDVALRQSPDALLASVLRRLVVRRRVTIEVAWPHGDGSGREEQATFEPSRPRQE
jgi:hypothetical protein